MAALQCNCLCDPSSVMPLILVDYGSPVHVRLVAIAHTAALAYAATGVLFVILYMPCEL